MHKNTKILLATLEYPPNCGGVGIYLKNLVIKSQNLDIKVLKHEKNASLDYNQDIWQSDFFYKYFHPHWLKLFFILKKIRKNFDFEVLYISHALPVGYVGLLFKKIFKINYIIFLHGFDFKLSTSDIWHRFWIKKILKNSLEIICNSNTLKKEVENFVGENEEIKIIYPTPSLDLVEKIKNLDNQKLEDLKNKYNILEESLTLITVGRLVKRKGQMLVLKALKNILQNNKDYKINYFIVGDGPEENNLKKFVQENNLSNFVFFTGHQDPAEDLAYYYKMSDIFVMPTRNLGSDVEGFGIVYLEAGLFNLPVIAGAGLGVHEAVLENKTGFIVEKNLDLEEKLEILIKNKDLRKNLGKAGREHAEVFLS